MNLEYDIIVIGGGHAGCEAAAAAANLGSRVLLVSMDLTKLAQMSCNPAIGGVGKGQIVREIDALGGLTAVVTDLTTIHFRMLNTSKGNAMWSPRAQCDRLLFSKLWREELEAIPNLDLFQDEVTEISIKNKIISGIKTRTGLSFKTRILILTNGTFLNGLIHIGEKHFEGGRIGELPSKNITKFLLKAGIETKRMKTGTPVRIDGRSLVLKSFTEQKSEQIGKFSFLEEIKPNLPQRSCYIVHTNPFVHDILKSGFDRSPLFSGKIKGIGPRYCPSIEDKIHTFSSKTSHQLFLEPEGVSTNEMYLNGFSSSLPWEIQYKALRKIEGFENVKILRPGYAIEYDYFLPTQLKHTLESKIIPNLYFAGQVNGTTGYEEAAGQGIIAGINASLKIQNKEEFILRRDQAYIGVMIDDLVTKGVDEPYRVFTSRAEYRIILRQENADNRLTPIGYSLGLAKENRYYQHISLNKRVNDTLNYIYKQSVEPEKINNFLKNMKSSQILHKKKIAEIILRPEIRLIDVIENGILNLPQNESELINKIETEIKYRGYIEKEQQTANKLVRLENILISEKFDYFKLESLSTEARQKLSKIKPKSIGQAKRIPGVSPSDINVLLIHLNR